MIILLLWHVHRLAQLVWNRTLNTHTHSRGLVSAFSISLSLSSWSIISPSETKPYLKH